MKKSLVLFLLLSFLGQAKADATFNVDAPFPYSLEKLNLEPLPLNYMGNDPKEIYNGVVELLRPKGEFETTAEYLKRKENLEEKNITTEFLLRDTLAFQLKPKSLEIKYNADEETFRIRVKDWTEYSEGGRYVKGFTLREDVVDPETYKAQNGFGATFDVSKFTLQSFAMVMGNFSRFSEYQILDLTRYSGQLNKRDCLMELAHGSRP